MLRITKFLFIVSFISILFSGSINAGYLLPGEEEYAIATEKQPTPVDGIQSIYKKISYPQLAQKSKIEGKVYVLILINESGSVDDAKVVKGIGGGCDEEALKAILKTKFTPGIVSGAPVKSKLSMAIQFKLI
jgi:periplasmic protein TonB